MVIDTDTASDDAVALVMALRHPEVSVEAITVVAGNVGVAQGTQNALYTAELCGSGVPVHQGCDRPLHIPLEDATNVHGTDGMGDRGLPLSGRVPASTDGVHALVDAIRAGDDDVTLVTLGPLTNVAAALFADRDLARRVDRCVMMVGIGDHQGNVSPVAEYNAWADPHALDVVLRSGMPLTMVGWDISRHYAVIDAALSAELRAIDTPVARFAMDIQSHVEQFCAEVTHLDGFDLPDPIAMAVALEPAMATTKRVHIEADPREGPTRGMTIVDHLGIGDGEPNVDLVTHVDRAAFVDLLRRSLS
ncbi:MAG: nucleoside hydrolase [Actinomycetota bacterium]|nr:nucleoside hydrolase [Actinomycetota bacterium]